MALQLLYLDTEKYRIVVDIPRRMRYHARMNDATMDLTTPDGMARAVAWQTAATSLMKDGTVWVIPRSLTIVQVYPTKKSVTVRTPGYASMFKQVKLVFLNMGWTVVEQS